MLYTLRNGRTVNISVDQMLRMTDQDFNDLEAENVGSYIENPFHDSALNSVQIEDIIKETDELLEDIIEIPDEFFENEEE